MFLLHLVVVALARLGAPLQPQKALPARMRIGAGRDAPR